MISPSKPEIDSSFFVSILSQLKTDLNVFFFLTLTYEICVVFKSCCRVMTHECN